MIDQPLPPMPMRALAAQLAYADMIAAVQDIIRGTRLTPQMALILAFLGDQTMSPADIRRHGYFIGSSTVRSLKLLRRDHLIERIEGSGNRRPIRLTPVGRRMAASIRSSLARTAPAIPSIRRERA